MRDSTSIMPLAAGRLAYSKGIRPNARFFFPSNPKAELKKHRVPELVDHMAKNNIDGIKEVLSDAFQAEARKHNMSLFEVIRVAYSVIEQERADYKAAVSAAKAAAKQAEEDEKLKKARKPSLGEVA